MNEIISKFVGADSELISGERAAFINLNLDLKSIEHIFTPFLTTISHRIETTYKAQTKISFGGPCFIDKRKLADCLQFDDICVKFIHVDTGYALFAILGAQLARQMILRLLSTSLVDDSHGFLFSSTEKGIFSFIVARLLFDLKTTLGNNMPNLKLAGIYHSHDDACHESEIKNCGFYNFSLSLGKSVYSIMAAIPTVILKLKRETFTLGHLKTRCGHLKWPLIVRLKTLEIPHNAIEKLSFGDMILFDRSASTISQGALSGPIEAIWQQFALSGVLTSTNGSYAFRVGGDQLLRHMGDTDMEEITISEANGNNSPFSENDHKPQALSDLVKNIRASLSIELARLPMTLKEICDIKEGEIIDLHRKIDDPLEIVVENKVIGYCHPVQIDGRLGIRVLKMCSEDSPN